MIYICIPGGIAQLLTLLDADADANADDDDCDCDYDIVAVTLLKSQ